jgi:hypothetical protein
MAEFLLHSAREFHCRPGRKKRLNILSFCRPGDIVTEIPHLTLEQVCLPRSFLQLSRPTRRPLQIRALEGTLWVQPSSPNYKRN